MAAFVMFLGSLFWMQSYGAYAVVFNREFGWSMTLLSGAFALTRVESGLLGPLQGWMVDRYGPRSDCQYRPFDARFRTALADPG